MGNVFIEFMTNIKDATYSLNDIWLILKDFYANLISNQHIEVLKDFVMGYIGFLTPYVPFILLGLSIVVALFGNRIFPILRFLVCFVAGFALGIYFLAPPILNVLPKIPTWVIGVITGVLAAVLSKLIFVLAVASCVAYPVYMVCMQGTLIPALTSYTKGNWIFSLGIVCIFLVAVLLLRKLLKSLGTAMLGGFGIAYIIKGWYDYTAISAFAGYEKIVLLSVTCVFALIGLIVQYKVRKRF